MKLWHDILVERLECSACAELSAAARRIRTRNFLRIVDAARHEESRDAAIGYTTGGKLLYVVHLIIEEDTIRLISAAKPTNPSVKPMIPEKLKARLSTDRRLVPVTLRMPQDVIDSLKTIAPLKGVSGYQALLKLYVSEGLRRDEAEHVFGPAARLAEALRKLGVSSELIEAAAREAAA